MLKLEFESNAWSVQRRGPRSFLFVRRPHHFVSPPAHPRSLSWIMSSRAKRKRVHTQIRTDIPAQDAVVTCVKVTRGSSQKIRTKSTKVSIPVTEDPSSQHLPLETPEPPPSALDSDPSPPTKKARKGPSRSVAVRVILSPTLPNAC